MQWRASHPQSSDMEMRMSWNFVFQPRMTESRRCSVFLPFVGRPFGAAPTQSAALGRSMGKGTVVRQSGSRRARRLVRRPSTPFIAGLPILNEAESAWAHKAINPLGPALRTAAMTARRGQAVVGDMLRARCPQGCARREHRDHARMACLICLKVTRGEEYIEVGMDACQKRRTDRIRANLHRKARSLGCPPVQPAEDREVPEDGWRWPRRPLRERDHSHVVRE